MTKLQAANYLLKRAGLYTVPALDTEGSSTVAQAERIIDEKVTSIQQENWGFNRRHNVTMTPDGSGHLMLSQITEGAVMEICADPNEVDCWRHLTIKDDRLYDIKENTDVFSGNVIVRYTVELTYDELPPAVQQYVAAAAACAFNESYGQQGRQPVLDRELDRFKTMARGSDSRVSSVNLLESRNVRRMRGNRRTFPPVGGF